MNSTILEGSVLSEPVVGIDSLARAESTIVSIPGVRVTTTAVASADGRASWLPALVRGGLDNIFVGFHDVHFPTPDTTNLVGITVVVTTTAWVGLATPVVTWHAHSVQSSIARAGNVGEGNIEGKSLILKDELVVVVRFEVV